MTERRSKYNSIPVDCDGYHFDSMAELRRYNELRLLTHTGEIGQLEVHPRYLIVPKDGNGRALYYEADFSYVEYQSNTRVVEDVKGVKTAVYQLKKRLFLARYREVRFMEIPA